MPLNMKQIGMALHIYSTEYDCRFPNAVPWGSPAYWSLPENGNRRTIQQLWPHTCKAVEIIFHKASDGTYSDAGVFGLPE